MQTDRQPQIDRERRYRKIGRVRETERDIQGFYVRINTNELF